MLASHTRIFSQQYESEQLLGEGFFGKVYRMKNIETQERVAVKIIDKT